MCARDCTGPRTRAEEAIEKRLYLYRLPLTIDLVSIKNARQIDRSTPNPLTKPAERLVVVDRAGRGTVGHGQLVASFGAEAEASLAAMNPWDLHGRPAPAQPPLHNQREPPRT